MCKFRGYISESVNHLFKILLNDALGKVSWGGKHWKETLDVNFHHFEGAYHGEPNAYQVEVKADGDHDLSLSLKMRPQGCGRKPIFFDSEEYAKRLVGNAYSVPVMEHLLKPLQRMFRTRDYPAFQYEYPWEEAHELHPLEAARQVVLAGHSDDAHS